MSAEQNVDYQIDENVGVTLTIFRTADYQVDENIGVTLTIFRTADYQVDENFTMYIEPSSGGKFIRLLRKD